MFDDFGGRDALSGWTRAWVYGVWPYVIALGLAGLLVIVAGVVGARGAPRRLIVLVLVAGAAVVVATLVGAFSAFYLPLFAPAR